MKPGGRQWSRRRATTRRQHLGRHATWYKDHLKSYLLHRAPLYASTTLDVRSGPPDPIRFNRCLVIYSLDRLVNLALLRSISSSSVGLTGAVGFSALGRGCNFSMHRPVDSWYRRFNRSTNSCYPCPIHLSCHLDTSKIFDLHFFTIFLDTWQQFGHLDYGLDYIRETWKSYKYALTNFVSPIDYIVTQSPKSQL